MKNVLILLLMIFSWSACQESGTTAIDFDTELFFNTIQEVDNCLQKGEDFGGITKRMDQVIKVPIDTITSTATLKYLYYEAQKRQLTAPKKKDGCVDTNFATKYRVLEKLTALGNNEAMQVILDIYKDTDIELIGNEAKSFMGFMISFGQAMGKELGPIKDLRPQIGPAVLQQIQANN